MRGQPHRVRFTAGAVLTRLDGTLRRVAHVFSTPLIHLLKPIKLFAYRTRFEWLKRLILEITTFFDWAMVFANIQNETMLLHHHAWKGNLGEVRRIGAVCSVNHR